MRRKQNRIYNSLMRAAIAAVLISGLAAAIAWPRPEFNRVELSYSENPSWCLNCPQFEVDLFDGGIANYRCVRACAVPGERQYRIDENQFRDSLAVLRSSDFFSISRTDPTRTVFDATVIKVTYRDAYRIHEIVDDARNIPRLTGLEKRIRAASDVQRFLKPSVPLYQNLVKEGWDVNTVSADQQNALFSAISDPPSAHFLLEHGARVTDGVLSMAAGEKNVEMFQELFRAHGKPSAQLTGQLLSVAAARSPEILRFLLDTGVNVNARGSEGVTPLIAAARQSDSQDNLRLLLERSADVNARDGSGRTALSYAATASNTGVIDVLVRHGANVNAQDNEGRTPLMHAADMCYVWDIRALLQAGADPRLADKKGRTALQPEVSVPTSDPKCEESRKVLQEALGHSNPRKAN
ncbi:MAG TPA: ankyrin repeat domain-containing protein [Candidatus Acidoferrales bacterium]|nr:ankyrin repeat domain-containing protein [Candidatus Acidoferrales bacterium]